MQCVITAYRASPQCTMHHHSVQCITKNKASLVHCIAHHYSVRASSQSTAHHPSFLSPLPLSQANTHRCDTSPQCAVHCCDMQCITTMFSESPQHTENYHKCNAPPLYSAFPQRTVNYLKTDLDHVFNLLCLCVPFE